MAESSQRSGWVGLIVADVIILALVTLSGFASHGTLGSAGTRILATFFPLLAGWLAVAPLFGAYDIETIAHPTRLWRPFWAAVIGATVAAVLRGAWLNAPVLPVFALVLAGVASSAMLAWRLVYWLLFVRRRAA